MKTYMCDNCGHSGTVKSESGISFCPNCGVSKEKIRFIEEKKISTEIDAIIESVLEESIMKVDSKIINKNEEDKAIIISEDNSVVEKNYEKCINCGQCKKVCENIANLRYDLNKCINPICTGCGHCIINCPTKSLTLKKEYRIVKSIMDANEKIVVGILSPSVYLSIAELFNFNKDINAEKKLIGALRKLGFDYVFSSSFGSDILVLEETAEFIDRLSKKEQIPFFTSSCPAWVKYAEIYHPELINNISACKNPIEMQNEIIKNYFSERKGFDSSRIVTVSISSCSARKMEKIESNLSTDYFITANDLSLLMAEEEIDLANIDSSDYDSIVGETSGSGNMMCVSGGHAESLIRTIYRIINKKDLEKDELDIYELRGNEDIREAKIQMNTFKLRVAVVSDMQSLEKLLEDDKYKKYHIIDVSYCMGGCINGGGQVNIEKNNFNSSIVYQIDKNSSNRFAHNNKELKELYKKYLTKPNSDISKKLLHTSYKDRSLLLENK